MLHDGAVRTILFDVGNTLTYLDHQRLARVFEREGHSRPLDDVRSAEHRARRLLHDECRHSPSNDASRWQRFLGALVAEAGAPESSRAALCESIHRAHRAENLWRYVPPGTRETLARLRAEGFVLGVVSNADGRVAALLQELDLHGAFDVIVDSFHVGVEKPDPAIFALALDALDAPASTSLYVGDLYTVDVLGARAAGMHAALLDPLGMSPETDCVVLRAIDEVSSLVSAGARSGERETPPRT